MNNYKRGAFLASVREAKFRTFVRPGERLMIEAKVTHDGSGYAMTEAAVKREAKTICDATLTMSVLDFPNAEMERQMRQVATSIGLTVEARADG